MGDGWLLFAMLWVAGAVSVWAQPASPPVATRSEPVPVTVTVGYRSLPLEMSVTTQATASDELAVWVPAPGPVEVQSVPPLSPAASWPVTTPTVVPIRAEAGQTSAPARPAPGRESVGPTETLQEFMARRSDIFEQIPQWNPDLTTPKQILREWVKITTERNADYETAKALLAGM